MKQIVLSFFFIGLSYSAFSQFEVGIKAGVHSYDISNVVDLQLENEDYNFTLTPLQADYGVQFGIYSRINLLGIYIEPATIFNSSKFTYKLTASDIPEVFKEETFLNLDIPLLVGFRVLRILRLQGGPVGHITLDSTSELFDIKGFSQTFDDIEFGYQAGIGIDFWRLRLDMLYENDINNFGDHITIHGQQFSFSDRAARLVFNVGLKF